MKKYKTKDGFVGVLVSGGYGAGWSTWNRDEYREFFTMDHTLVAMQMAYCGEDEVAAYISNTSGEEYSCTQGWENTEVIWLPEGTVFTILEYNGHESIEYAVSDYLIT